jgi:cytochrome b
MLDSDGSLRMKRILIWDLAVRLFHWGFAGSLVAALGVAFLADKHGALFQWHMLFGMIALFLVALRVVLGLAGSRYARFARWPVRPREIAGYFRGVWQGGVHRYAGHNPGSALAALAMLALVPLLFVTGLDGGRDPWEEMHEVLAYGLAGVIGAHLLGLLGHAWRQRENVLLPMITGRKPGLAEEELRRGHYGWAVGVMASAVVWIGGLLRSHDASAGTVRLPLTGPTIHLGEDTGRETPRVKEKRIRHREHKH